MAELVTTGSGEVERVADEAALQLRYASTAKDRTGAVNDLTKQTRLVEPLLDRPGVTVRSRQLSVHDIWEGRRRTGAQADQSYQLRITDVAVLNDLLGDVIATEPADLSGPFWNLADMSDARREAQREAVADARAKAQGYADALGGRLGQLLRLDDGSGARIVRAMSYGEAAMPKSRGAAPTVADLSLDPQQVTVPVTCTITWELLA